MSSHNSSFQPLNCSANSCQQISFNQTIVSNESDVKLSKQTYIGRDTDWDRRDSHQPAKVHVYVWSDNHKCQRQSVVYLYLKVVLLL